MEAPADRAGCHRVRARVSTWRLAFERRVFVDGAMRLPYRLHRPTLASADARHPLVLPLHGSGAIGTDNESQLGAFAGTWLTGSRALAGASAPFVVVPQVTIRSATYAADSEDGLPSSSATPALATMLRLVGSLVRALPVDPARIYVVGFSMGGSATWNALLASPHTFAAAVVIAGVPPHRATAAEFEAVPVLVLHSVADPESSFEATRTMVDRICRDAGNACRVHLRRYEVLGHEIPPDVLHDDWWQRWLFEWSRQI
jgi:predicted peptidase